MYPKNEIMFPHKSIASLRMLRGPEWQALADRVAKLPETDEESLAFCLMLIRICECLNCDLGSYKASLGCNTCARRAAGSTKANDADLLEQFARARQDVARYLRDGILCIPSDDELQGSAASEEALLHEEAAL
ncbi:MAG: hypothetical protein GX605_09510 [Chloroflexi bacterium]|nr:hypothetical protein [Chloroflexota bacterium]